MIDPLKSLVFEWIITNGSFPGFSDRLNATKSEWKTVTEDMTVYRGQGHTKKNIPLLGPPNVLKGDVRSVISTSKQRESVSEYAGTDCCVFQITLKPGVKYIDTEAVVIAEEEYDEIADELRKRAPADSWIKEKTPRRVMKAFFLKNLKKEHEIMVLGGGSFSELVSQGGTPEVFTTSYSSKTAGRRRSRRKTRRSKYNR